MTLWLQYLDETLLGTMVPIPIGAVMVLGNFTMTLCRRVRRNLGGS